MNARELIHALSAEWIDQDVPVQVFVPNGGGDEFGSPLGEMRTVTKVTARGGHVMVEYDG